MLQVRLLFWLAVSFRSLALQPIYAFPPEVMLQDDGGLSSQQVVFLDQHMSRVSQIASQMAPMLHPTSQEQETTSMHEIKDLY